MHCAVVFGNIGQFNIFSVELYNIHYMTKSVWTPACRTSHSKIMGINMELVPPCCYKNSLHFWEDFPKDVGTLLWKLASIQPLVRSGTAIRPGSQSAFQFFPKVFDGVVVRALCRPVKFLHTNRQTISVWTSLCPWVLDYGNPFHESPDEQLVLTLLPEAV